jgi:hypothetical protein
MPSKYLILTLSVVACVARADDIFLDLDRALAVGPRPDPKAKPQVRPDGYVVIPDVSNETRQCAIKQQVSSDGFAIQLQIRGRLQNLQPSTIQLQTQQKGRWREPKLESGRYVRCKFDVADPRRVDLESTLDWNLDAGDERVRQEIARVQKELQRRTTGKERAAQGRIHVALLLEHILAVRAENVEAGADPTGKPTRTHPPLPRPAGETETPKALERVLQDQCRWQSVAAVYRATGFSPPTEKERADFISAALLAEEIDKAVKGQKGPWRALSESQYTALSGGVEYTLTASFVPEADSAPIDLQWRTAPAVRLADGAIARARLEGTLDRDKGRTVAWWRVDCDTHQKIQAEMTAGEGDCFWTWVHGPNAGERYIRVLLHSAGARYRLNLSLGGARGEEVTLYDAPGKVRTSRPF